jgi:hypothetical protein
MKKFIIVLVTVVMLILAACGSDYYDRVISNQSSKIVSYVYDGRTETLAPYILKVYSVTLAVHEPSSITFDGHPKSIVVESEGWNYIFAGVTPIPLVVKNTLGSVIKIENEYIDYSPTGTEYYTSFNVAANKVAAPAVVYTATPVFTITPVSAYTYPITADYQIASDGTMYVVIR